MKRIGIICLAFVWLFPAYLAGQEAEDPGIILPAVILEIDDLNIEKVEAGLPEGSDIQLPGKELFMPDEITLSVAEPNFSLDLAGTAWDDPGLTGGIPAAGSSIIAEAMLGAGSTNSIVSLLSFYKSGDLPRFRFLFGHEMMDGYGWRPAGTGFSSRYDELNASLLLDLKPGELESAFTYKDSELGQQNRGDYFSVINRFLSSTNSLKYGASSVLDFTATFGIELAALMQTAGDPSAYATKYPPTEFILHPEIKGTFDFDSIDLGLLAGYKFRFLDGSSAYNLHRLLARLDLKIDSSFWLGFGGYAAFFRSDDIPALFPFQLSLSGSPTRSFSFALRGGYSMEENDIGSLLDAFEYLSLPEPPADNHGWNGELALNLNLPASGWGLAVNAAVQWNSMRYAPGPVADVQTALLGLVGYPEVLSSDVTTALSWQSSGIFRVELDWHNLVLWRTVMPVVNHEFKLQADLKMSNDVLGSRLEAVLDTGTAVPFDLPVVNASAYYRALDNLNLVLEGRDLLAPLLGGDRIQAAPYIAPGMVILVKIEINL